MTTSDTPATALDLDAGPTGLELVQIFVDKLCAIRPNGGAFYRDLLGDEAVTHALVAVYTAAGTSLRAELAEVTRQRDEAREALEEARWNAMGEDL